MSVDHSENFEKSIFHQLMLDWPGYDRFMTTRKIFEPFTEFPVDKSIEEAGLAHAAVSEDEELEQVVVIHHWLRTDIYYFIVELFRSDIQTQCFKDCCWLVQRPLRII